MYIYKYDYFSLFGVEIVLVIPVLNEWKIVSKKLLEVEATARHNFEWVKFTRDFLI